MKQDTKSESEPFIMGFLLRKAFVFSLGVFTLVSILFFAQELLGQKGEIVQGEPASFEQSPALELQETSTARGLQEAQGLSAGEAAAQQEYRSFSENKQVASYRPAVTYKDALWLGVVEGIMEFLPVSSTAHLILVAEGLDLNDQTPLYHEKSGNPIWYRSPDVVEEGIPMTRKRAVDTYNIVLQGGTILAVIFLYWPTIIYLLRGCLGADTRAVKMSLNIVLAFIPIVPAGILIEPLINKMFQSGVIVWGLLIGTVAIVIAELWRSRRMASIAKVLDKSKETQAQAGEEGFSLSSSFGHRGWDELTPLQAIGIGLIQCLALIPGFSRALSAILGGYLVGLRPAQAAEFSFLVGLPTVLGAALYKGYKDGAVMLEVTPTGPLLFGLLISAITAVIAILWLKNHIRKWGLWGFVVYRTLLVAAIFVFMGAGFDF